MLARLALGLLAALLPEELRERIVRRWGVDDAAWSFLVGMAELLFCGLWLVGDFMEVVPRLVSANTGAFLDAADARLLDAKDAELALYWSGSLGWMAWALRPATLLMAGFTLVGIVRLVSFGVNREAVPEPALWLAWQATKLALRPVRAAEERRRFGPERPLRSRREEGVDLVVLSSRPLTINAMQTLQVGDRFYRLLRQEERPDGPWRAHAYLLREEDPSAVIRGLIRLDVRGPRGHAPAAEP